MGEGRETAAVGKRPTAYAKQSSHEELIERIASDARSATREERARVVVDAIAELHEQSPALAAQALAGLLEDKRANERIATWLGCAPSEISQLLGGATVALLRAPACPGYRAQIADALKFCLPRTSRPPARDS